jgi:hypothetical protein
LKQRNKENNKKIIRKDTTNRNRSLHERWEATGKTCLSGASTKPFTGACV